DGVITDKRAPILDYLLGVGEIFFVGSGLGNPGDIGYCKGCPAEKELIHNTTVGSDGLLIKTPLPYLVIPIDVPDGGTKISVELQGATEVDRVNYALVHIEGKDMERVTYSLPKIGTYEFADLMAFS